MLPLHFCCALPRFLSFGRPSLTSSAKPGLLLLKHCFLHKTPSSYGAISITNSVYKSYKRRDPFMSAMSPRFLRLTGLCAGRHLLHGLLRSRKEAVRSLSISRKQKQAFKQLLLRVCVQMATQRWASRGKKHTYALQNTGNTTQGCFLAKERTHLNNLIPPRENLWKHKTNYFGYGFPLHLIQ